MQVDHGYNDGLYEIYHDDVLKMIDALVKLHKELDKIEYDYGKPLDDERDICLKALRSVGIREIK